jgi:hypothetical protein
VWELSDAMQTGGFPSPSVQRVPKDVFCSMDTKRFDQRPICCIVRESRCQSRGSLFRQPVSMEMCISGRASADLDSSLVRFRHESVSNSSPDGIKYFPCHISRGYASFFLYRFGVIASVGIVGCNADRGFPQP